MSIVCCVWKWNAMEGEGIGKIFGNEPYMLDGWIEHNGWMISLYWCEICCVLPFVFVLGVMVSMWLFFAKKRCAWGIVRLQLGDLCEQLVLNWLLGAKFIWTFLMHCVFSLRSRLCTVWNGYCFVNFISCWYGLSNHILLF